MCTCHTNHSVDCIKERIKLTVRKYNAIYISLEICQITVHCSVKHFRAYYLAILPLQNDVTSCLHHEFLVSFLLYIATKKLNQIITVNSSTNAPITQKK